MSITITQKIIKVGSSSGNLLPARELKELGVGVGDEVIMTIRKKATNADDQAVFDAAASVLNRYKQDFKNLAGR